MNRLLKTFGLSLPTFVFVFILSAVGFSLFYPQPASAYNVIKSYTVYKKTGTNNHLYYNGVNSTFTIINWSPRININKNPNNCSGYNGDANIISSHKYTNCKGLTIQEVAGEPNNTWFEQAQYSFEIGDFDHSETMYAGGGYISNHGSSTYTPTPNSNPGKYQNILAKEGDNGCDTPKNPDYSDSCSVLVLFNPTYRNDFRITLDNTEDSASHEYWYEGPKSGEYQTLTFNPNGGSVVDDKVQTDGTIGDEATLWSHTSGVNVLREYVDGANANEYPIPTRTGYTFQEWYTAPSGGTTSPSRSMSNDETLYAHWAQVVTGDFKNEPAVSATPKVIEEGATVTTKYTITNSGSSPTTPTSWWIYRQVTSGPKTLVTSGTGLIVNPGSPWLRDDTDSNTGGLATGTQICYYLNVSPISQSDIGTTETYDCVVVGKKPKIQVWGGDLLVGGNTQTSVSIKSNNTFGSWAEYGIFATGIIKGTASGSAFAGPGLANSMVCSYSTLSFANADNSDCIANQTAGGSIGNYTNSRSIPDVSAIFSGGSNINPARVTANNLPTTAGTYIGNRNGDLILDPSTLSPGKSIIIKATGTVTIAGDQINNPDNNGNKYTSTSQLPQLVIIADKIIIKYGVTKVDAWLIAKNSAKTGSIYTCDLIGRSIDECDKQLVVNGPVMTNKLYLRRTAGSEPNDSGAPAEVFNLRADAYLWAFARASINGRIQTVYTTELPPRF